MSTTKPIPPLCGILNVDKPEYKTSREMVNQVQKRVKPNKVGHAGTLDPLATGVLLVCVGKATQLVTRIQEMPKVYRAGFTLGVSSDTDDRTGSLIKTDNPQFPTKDDLENALQQFIGEIEQVPPQFSAVHVQGRRAYDLARKGREVELKPRPVQIYEMNLLSYTAPKLEVEIKCGSGTYIRSLARDLGKMLNCGGLMHSLVRTAIGPFSLENAIPGETLSERADFASDLEDCSIALPDLPRFHCDETQAEWLKNGRVVKSSGEIVAGKNKAELLVIDPQNDPLCLAEYSSHKEGIQPRLVFKPLPQSK